MGASQPRSPSALLQLVRTFTLAIRLFFDSRVPLWAKIVPLAAVAYIIFPLDILPDFIPGFGQLDDLTILLVGLWAFVHLCPGAVVREYSGEADVVDGSYRVIQDDESKQGPANEQIDSSGR